MNKKINWYVFKVKNNITITSDWLIAKKNTHGVEGSIYRKFEHFESACDYIKNHCEDLPIEFQVSINENDYSKTIFVDLTEQELKIYNSDFYIYTEELKEITKEEYKFNELGNLVFTETENYKYNSLLSFLISIELGEFLNVNRIIYNQIPDFNPDYDLGFGYNTLLKYCIETKKEISSKIIIKENDLFDDFKLFLE